MKAHMGRRWPLITRVMCRSAVQARRTCARTHACMPLPAKRKRFSQIGRCRCECVRARVSTFNDLGRTSASCTGVHTRFGKQKLRYCLRICFDDVMPKDVHAYAYVHVHRRLQVEVQTFTHTHRTNAYMRAWKCTCTHTHTHVLDLSFIVQIPVSHLGVLTRRNPYWLALL